MSMNVIPLRKGKYEDLKGIEPYTLFFTPPDPNDIRSAGVVPPGKPKSVLIQLTIKSQRSNLKINPRISRLLTP